MARFVSFLLLLAILVIVSIIFFQVMAGFFVPLFLAALLWRSDEAPVSLDA